jgi:hypothetical protein
VETFGYYRRTGERNSLVPRFNAFLIERALAIWHFPCHFHVPARFEPAAIIGPQDRMCSRTWGVSSNQGTRSSF